MGFDAADRLGGGPADGAGVVAAEVDGRGVLGDVDGNDLPGRDAAEDAAYGRFGMSVSGVRACRRRSRYRV
jgi:hypothetical protein